MSLDSEGLTSQTKPVDLFQMSKRALSVLRVIVQVRLPGCSGQNAKLTGVLTIPSVFSDLLRHAP